MRWFYAIAAVLAVLVGGQAHALTIEMKPPTLVAEIDIAAQRMKVIENGEVIHTWKVSTGTRRHATPSGTWSPYRMHKMWRSRKYNNAPMPYAVFYNQGYAVHGTNAVSRLGSPASHGCTRLHTANAKIFYHLVRKHKRVRTQVRLVGQFDFSKWKQRVVKKKRVRKVRRKLTRAQRRARQLQAQRIKRRNNFRRVWSGNRSASRRQTFFLGIVR